jgi:hypothetical protein
MEHGYCNWDYACNAIDVRLHNKDNRLVQTLLVTNNNDIGINASQCCHVCRLVGSGNDRDTLLQLVT